MGSIFFYDVKGNMHNEREVKLAPLIGKLLILYRRHYISINISSLIILKNGLLWLEIRAQRQGYEENQTGEYQGSGKTQL